MRFLPHIRSTPDAWEGDALFALTRPSGTRQGHGSHDHPGSSSTRVYAAASLLVIVDMHRYGLSEPRSPYSTFGVPSTLAFLKEPSRTPCVR